jgi:hypothetical protein
MKRRWNFANGSNNCWPSLESASDIKIDMNLKLEFGNVLGMPLVY